MQSTVTQTINRYELAKAFQLHTYTNSNNKLFLSRNLISIEQIPNMGCIYKFTFEKTDGEDVVVEHVFAYTNTIISVKRIGDDSFTVVSTNALKTSDAKDAKMYSNSPLVNENVWKTAILLASLTPAEITIDFNKEYLEYNYCTGKTDKKVAAFVKVLLLDTGKLYTFPGTYLRPDQRLYYLAMRLPNQRMVIRSRPSSGCVLHIDAPDDHHAWWFSGEDKECSFDAVLDWTPEK